MKQLCIGLCNFACDGMSCVVVVRWTVALIRCHGYTCRINRTSSSLTPFHMLEGPSVSLSRSSSSSSIPQIVKTPPFHHHYGARWRDPARDSGNSSHWFPLSPLDVANVEKLPQPKQQDSHTFFQIKIDLKSIPENDYEILIHYCISLNLKTIRFVYIEF